MIDQDLLEQMQFAVVEPPDGGASWPSGLWTRDEVLDNINQRQSKLLKNALILLTISTPVAVTAAVPLGDNHTLVSLPQDLIRLVGAIWIGANGNIREVMRADTFEADHLMPGWDQGSTGIDPLVYFEYESGTLQIRIAPPPWQNGTLTFLYVAQGTTMTGDGIAVTVPAELAHVIKYGALADMLSKDGRGKDPTRAQYCEDRFQLGVELARIVLKGWA